MGKQRLKSQRAAAAAQQPGFSWFPPIKTRALHEQPKIDRSCLCLQRGTCCCSGRAVTAGSACEAGLVRRPVPARVTCRSIPRWSGAAASGCCGGGHPLPPPPTPPHRINRPRFVAAPREGRGEASSPHAAAVAGGSVLPPTLLLEQTGSRIPWDVRLAGALWAVLAALLGCVAPSVFPLPAERSRARAGRWRGLLLAERVPHHL